MELRLGAEGRIQIVDGKVGLDLDPKVGPGRRQELTEGALRAIEHWHSGGYAIHGSCVEVEGRVCAFIGQAGSGKSTLTVGVVSNGARLISDGMTLVDPESRRVAAGPARCKLLDESIERLNINSAGSFVNESRRKRFVPVNAAPMLVEPTLSVGYVLVDDTSEFVQTLGPQEQIRELLTHDYLARLLPPGEQGRALMKVAALLRSGLVLKRLHRRKEWAHFSNLVRIVLEDLRGGEFSLGRPESEVAASAPPQLERLQVRGQEQPEFDIFE